MTNKLLAALLAALATACIAEPAPEADDPGTVDRASLEDRIYPDDLEATDDDRSTTRNRGDDSTTLRDVQLCERVIATEGACAYACDKDAALGFVPKGACAFFQCELDDGSFINVGGCNN